MNQTQRKFLIERITGNVKAKIEALKSNKMGSPSASNYIFRAIMNNDMRLQDGDVIISAIKEKALKAKEGSNWLTGNNNWYGKEQHVVLEIEKIIVLPDDYKIELDRVNEHNKQIDEKIRELQIQLETIEVRIQLASDKTLQKLINEVDDMGDISLIDTKIKLIE